MLKARRCQPMTYPDRISVYHKLREAPAPTPATSLALDCVILSHRHRRVSARAFEDVVVYDYREARKTAMPQFMQDVLSRIWHLQQEETRRARARIWELVGAVEALEKETWDQPDAVEDMGAAASGKQ